MLQWNSSNSLFLKLLQLELYFPEVPRMLSRNNWAAFEYQIPELFKFVFHYLISFLPPQYFCYSEILIQSYLCTYSNKSFLERTKLLYLFHVQIHLESYARILNKAFSILSSSNKICSLWKTNYIPFEREVKAPVRIIRQYLYLVRPFLAESLLRFSFKIFYVSCLDR